MELETTIAKNIRVSDVKARYDAACKRLLSERSILAWIMKSCLEEYQGIDVKEIAEKYIEGQPSVGETPVYPDEAGVASQIHGISGEDASLHEGTVTYDIRFHATAPVSGELIRLIINVEAQNIFRPGYPLIKRGIYYCSRMISAQYGTEFTAAQYDRIKKVYSIWICMNPPENRKNSITRYSIREDNLVGGVREPIRDYDLLSVVMICLGQPEQGGEADVLKLLDVLLSEETEQSEKCRILQEEFDIPMTEYLNEEVSLMCNLSQGILEKGIEQGIERGVKQGIERGIEKGRKETLLSTVSALMETSGVSVEQAMDLLQIPEETREELKDRIARK